MWLLAIVWVMSSSSDTAAARPRPGFESTPEWIESTYERVRALSRDSHCLRVLPKAKYAPKPVPGGDRVRARVESFPLGAQRRVADRFSPFTLKDATANLDRYVMYVEGRPTLLLGFVHLLVRLRITVLLVPHRIV
jgi:hypothetical protein